jgi:hypothetical protein
MVSLFALLIPILFSLPFSLLYQLPQHTIFRSIQSKIHGRDPIGQFGVALKGPVILDRYGQRLLGTDQHHDLLGPGNAGV